MAEARTNSVREAMDTLQEISRLLNTGLDSETLSICVRLIEQGVNPEALASVIKELRRETAALKGCDAKLMMSSSPGRPYVYGAVICAVTSPGTYRQGGLFTPQYLTLTGHRQSPYSLNTCRRQTLD
ncbi:hypothetical protein Bbelb_407190 [Branchiostoma belcheri]|nr:hypothetical protein Bbelb_407190 [Branchiostoma belcheri]